jgi:hypothetical protein
VIGSKQVGSQLRFYTELTVDEIALGGLIVGGRRQLEAMRAQRPDVRGVNPKDGWSIQIEGSCSEQAFCKAMGVHWEQFINTFKTKADVRQLEIRGTEYESGHLLFEEDRDHEDRVYVLVIGLAAVLTGREKTAKYAVVGWAWGKEILKLGEPSHLNNPSRPQVATLGQEKLRSMEELLPYLTSLKDDPSLIPLPRV